MAPTLATTILTLCSILYSTTSAASCSNTKKVDYPAPQVADGWSYRLVADGLKNPRGIAFDKDGGLIVVDRGTGLVHLKLKDDGGTCVSVEDQRTILEDDNLNHGLAISSDGKTVYASDPDKAYSWDYDASKPSLSENSRRTLVTNMTNSGHSTRTLHLSSSKPGILLVSRGSQGNNDSEALELSSGHSNIRMFNISSPPEKAIDFMDGDLLGWGLRNSVGLTEHPDGGVWSVENSVDNLERMGEDIHKNNPGEEMNYHGKLDEDDKEMGANYGYPSCFALWDTDDVPDVGDLKTGEQFSPVNAGGDTDKKCKDDHVAPRITFQAHMAPLDIKFDKNGSTAFVTFHGSWNREEPVGYKISSIAFSDGQPSASSSSQSATKDILYTEDLSNCPDKCFRPVSMAFDSKQRMFFSSDSTGEIFVLAPSDGDDGGDDDDNDEGSNSSGGSRGNTGQSAGGDDEDGGLGMMQVAPRSAAWAVAFAAILAGMLLA